VSPFRSGTKPMLWCHTSAILTTIR